MSVNTASEMSSLSDAMDGGGAKASQCAWGKSCVAGKVLGCCFPGLVPCEICYVPNCASPKFHHGCQTEWEIALHRHDFPESDAGKCDYEAGHNYCMNHHPFASLAVELSSATSTADDDVEYFADNMMINREAETGEKETAMSKKNKEMIEFVERQTIDNVVLNSDKSDVVTLGGRPWAQLTVKAKKAFLRTIKVMIPQNKRTSKELGSVVANWINSQSIRSAVGAVIAQKKTSAATKPLCFK